jgi:hypothetical protein
LSNQGPSKGKSHYSDLYYTQKTINILIHKCNKQYTNKQFAITIDVECYTRWYLSFLYYLSSSTILFYLFSFSLSILPHCRYPMVNEWRVSENSRFGFVLWLTCIWLFPLEHGITQLFLLDRFNILWKIPSCIAFNVDGNCKLLVCILFITFMY